MDEAMTVQMIKKLLLAFMIILFLSGLTAIPVEAQLTFLLKPFTSTTPLHNWLVRVLSAYKNLNNDAPFLLYGYDWLAFAHFVLAILFIGPYRDPIRNIWVIQFGLIACVLIIPVALIAGSFRGIPIGWQLIDCSFGLFGSIPLWICYSKTKSLISPNDTNK
jgi:hypothetical protein